MIGTGILDTDRYVLCKPSPSRNCSCYSAKKTAKLYSVISWFVSPTFFHLCTLNPDLPGIGKIQIWFIKLFVSLARTNVFATRVWSHPFIRIFDYIAFICFPPCVLLDYLCTPNTRTLAMDNLYGWCLSPSILVRCIGNDYDDVPIQL